MNRSSLLILLLIADKNIRNHILKLLQSNNYAALVFKDPEKLAAKTKKLGSAIIFIDDKAVGIYGTRIYSRINVACPDCSTILLCNKDHQDLIKEAMDLGVYACILSPFAEWEVVTMIRNILAKKKATIQKAAKTKRRKAAIDP